MSSMADAPLPTTPAASWVPSNQQLSRNPQLPQHPLGAYTDAQYEEQIAKLRSQTARSYADILQQLGYVDPDTGQFIQGSVETEANRQRGELHRSSDLAAEGVTHQHQQEGTLFSGLRGTDQARAEYPYVNQIGQIETQTPLTLAGLYEKAGGLVDDYTLGQNQLLGEAARRGAAGLTSSGGVDSTPPPDATLPPIAPPAAPDTPITGMTQIPVAPTPAATGPLLQGPDARMAHPAISNSTLAAPPPTGILGSAIARGVGLAQANMPPPAPNTSGILSATQKKLLQIPQ